MYALDDVLNQLSRYRQRATYGAVGELVGQPPMFLMNGRPRDAHNSWVVSKETRLPSKYEKYQMHPDLESRPMVLETREELAHWLANPE